MLLWLINRIKMAKTIINCTKNKNQKIVTLDSLQAVKQEQIDKGYSYLKAMKHNLKVLKNVWNRMRKDGVY